MKFVALLSGGKDSCFNVIKCLEYGHSLVCLANLAPPDEFTGNDLDSFMFQTAGHNVIDYMADCFDVPLIRRHVMGFAVNQELDYRNEESGDEVEDMFLLLQEVKQKFPDILGVSCGAIISTYQRLRVESVCERLGFTVLSYLWQRDRVELLQEMVSNGVEAVLVKVAGAGLEPKLHLGKSLAELQPSLLKFHKRYGLDVCGEGGEYESIVLNCSVFKKRLQLSKTEIVVDSENDSVGYLRIDCCECVPKEVEVQGGGDSPSTKLLSSMVSVLKNVSEVTSFQTFQNLQGIPLSKLLKVQPSVGLSIGVDGYGQSSLLFPCVAPQESLPVGEPDNVVVQHQLFELMSRLEASLKNMDVAMTDIVFVHLYISSNRIFGAVNEEYCKWFSCYPPSRSCVCVSKLSLTVTQL
jgi:diphthine-ammonia ligase